MAGKRIVIFAFFALVAVAFALSIRTTAEAQTFKPVNSYSLTSTVPGANSNSVLATGIAAPDYNLEDASSTNLNPPDAKLAMGLEAPIGAYVGTLAANAAVGLMGGLCNSALPPNFQLKNSSVDISDELASTAWILKSAGTTPVPDTDGDGLYDYEEQYPWFLNDMFDPDGAGVQLPLQPRARYAGHTTVAGFNVLVQLVIFNPGQIAAAGGIYAQMTGDKGAASVVILDNPLGEGEASPGAISDFCSPLTTTTTLLATTADNPGTAANEAGYTRQTNPAANTGVLATQTHMALYYTQSERNSDGDLFENDLDGCRYSADPAAWNPRLAAYPSPCPPGPPGDNDCDMLPSSCDPNDASTNTDQDADGYDNAQDNCPLVANGCESAACGPIWNVNWNNQQERDSGVVDVDLGPRTDSLGDSCDDSDDDGNEDGAGAGTCNDGIDNGGDTTADGNDANCTASMDAVDWPITNPMDGTYYHGMPWAAVCVGGVDGDSDGYCAALETLLGSSDANGPETGAQCTNALDDDGDTFVNDGCPRTGKFSERGAECTNALNDDAAVDSTDGGVINDGCPVIGTPENHVIDATITAAAALPSATAPQSCSDGIDNDNDGATDAADANCSSWTGDPDFDGWADVLANGFGADIASDHAGNETYTGDGAQAVGAYTYNNVTGAVAVGTNSGQCWIVAASDTVDLDQEPEAQAECDNAGATADIDGDTDVDIVWFNMGDIPDASRPTGQDNCPGAFNPAQTNTDLGFAATSAFPAGDTQGDVCDTDDDADGFTDVVEGVLPTDPLDRCRNGSGATRSDAWGLDQDLNATITVVGDVLKYSGKIGASVSASPPTSWALSRLDLDNNRTITVVGDVLKYSGKIGASCT